MKQGIFISYSDHDKEKVNLIVKELEGNTMFYPIVIASNREALKPLAEKVAEGIVKSKIIVPILTAKSITTQWINQEIGFASALTKKIMPIIEQDIIDTLKGFIHKQIDLPYSYTANTNKASEHKDFVTQVRNLISDLERDYQAFVSVEELPEKSDFEKSLEEADRANAEIEFQRLRKAFLDSGEGLEAAKAEVLNMYSDIEEKIKILQEKKFRFSFDKEVYRPLFILRSEGISFSLAWIQPYLNTNTDAYLLVKYWDGPISKDGSAFYFPGEEPKVLSTAKYFFDRNRNGETCWLNQVDQNQYTNTQIVDSCLKWLVEQTTKKRLSKN